MHQYDYTDRLLRYAEKGSSFSHIIGYEYDEINNLTALVETINGTEHKTTYGYDDDNRVTSVGNGSANEAYTYDAYSRVNKKVTKNGSTTVLTDTFTYRAPTSTTTSGQIQKLQSVASGYNVTYSYTYDDNGNILSVSNGSATTSYVYDSTNQLTRENNQAAGKTWVWTYDDAGNILSKKEYAYTTGTLGSVQSTVNYTYDGTWGDLLTGYNGKTITSDTIGNMLSDGTWTYTWEHGRELATMSNGSTTWTNTYNADGLRTKRTNGSTTYNYIYNGSSLSQMTVGNNTLYFAYDASGTPMSVTYNGTNYYYATNVQGDVTAILNSSGTAVVQYTYDAWGKILTTTGSMASTLGTHNPLRYRGYVYDAETTLYYLQSRYYDPEMGRFISGDTFTSTGGLMGNNMMAYCLNNPANFFDNRGTDAIWIQEKERGGGYGHSGLLVDDGEGNWYFLYWGSAGTSTDLEKIFGTPYEFVFVEIDVSEYDLYSIDGVIDALANSGNGTAQIRSQYVTGTYYFEGDYSATYDYLSKMAEREENKPDSLGKYYLLNKNCAQVTWEALAQSNVRLQENSCPFIPNIAFGRAQYLDGMSNLHYGIFRSTMVAIN